MAIVIRAVIWTALVLAGLAGTVVAVQQMPLAQVAIERAIRPGDLSTAHSSLVDRCTACHQPGVGVTVSKCTACHASAERLLGRQPTAFHASIGECASCHAEHLDESIRPRTLDHRELARIGARTLAIASASDADSDATLKALEIWFRIHSPARPDGDAAHGALDCAGCHDRKDPHRALFGKDCAHCHALETWKVPGYQHPSPQSKDCVQCHRAPPSHFMEHFSMISRTVARKEHARVDQCFECHNTTSWNDIAGVGFYKHH